MYLAKVNCVSCNRQPARGLGFWTAIATAAGSYLASKNKGGSAPADPYGSPMAQPQPITVSPQISTQVSPQISPVFQQSYQSRDSAMTAGTQQTAPASFPGPAPGAYDPGFAAPYPAAGGDFPLIPTAYAGPIPGAPMQYTSGQSDAEKALPWIVGGGAALALVFMLRKKGAN